MLRFVLLFVFAVIGILPSSAQAHVLLVDGTMGVTMHIAPEDDPVARESSTFFVDFKDTQNTFALQKCICVATITRGGARLMEQHLTGTGVSTQFVFMFPARDVYRFTLSGESTDQSFNSFTVTHDIRVDREAAEQFAKTHDPFVRVALALVPLMVVAAWVAIDWRQKKNTL